MPFTFSHPFIVLPLCRKNNRFFSATGLITGSMALDFEYFIYMKKIEHESFHTLPGGVFIFGLPVGLLLTFVYHLLIRDQLIDNLPPVLMRRLYCFKQLNWLHYFRKNYLKVIISLLIGIYSHLLLDGLTHDFGVMVKWFPLLRQQLTLAGRTIPVYDMLQAALSVFGGVVIVYAILKLKPVSKITVPPPVNQFVYWFKFLLFFLITMTCRFLIDTHHNKPVDLLIAGIAGVLIAVFMVSLSGITSLVKQEQ